jgi:diacylglycerol kinase (ATP)
MSRCTWIGPVVEPGQWVGIVANRASGIGQGMRAVKRLVGELGRLGLHVELSETNEERSALVAQASEDARCRCLVAVGGDGTVSALINERPGVPITILPAGTENLAARHFGLGRDAAALARTIATSRPVRVDLGQTAGRRFVLMAGFGFDGDIVTRHHKARVSPSGRLRSTHRIAYFEPILRSSFSYQFPVISVCVSNPDAEEVLVGTTVFVFNLPRYALGLPFVPRASEDDGWLDLLVFQKSGPFQALYYLWKVVCGSHLEEPGVFHRRVRKVVVSVDEPVPVQLDGDPGGYVIPPIGTSGLAVQGVPSAHGAERFYPSPDEQPVPGSWVVEILPGALSVIPGQRSEAGSVPLPLARDGIAG